MTYFSEILEMRFYNLNDFANVKFIENQRKSDYMGASVQTFLVNNQTSFLNFGRGNFEK